MYKLRGQKTYGSLYIVNMLCLPAIVESQYYGILNICIKYILIIGVFFMGSFSDKDRQITSISCKGEIVDKLNGAFFNLTGYSDEEVIGKTVEELCELLKVNSKIFLDSVNSSKEYYLFMKNDKPRQVFIKSQYISLDNTQIYYIEENLSSNLENILKDIFTLKADDEKSICLYSLDNNILLKSNKNYIDILSSLCIPSHNLIGNAPILIELLSDPNNPGYYNKKMNLNL